MYSMYLCLYFSTDSLELVGEQEFHLKIFKEISVTESFMHLGDNERGCQDVEVQRNCTVQKYVQTKSKCGCVPLHLNLDDEDSICYLEKETRCSHQILNGSFQNCMRLR